ncbi:MAG: UpxY family transcription antiterminator [Lutibacter sp.]
MTRLHDSLTARLQDKKESMNWYVIYTKPKWEKKVADRLQKSGITVYCPMVTQIKQWSDRKKKVETPLIPSYVFVNIEEKNRNAVFEVPGVVRYLFWLGKPAIVREVEILALQESLKETLSSVEITTYKTGDIINIADGPFKGKEGIVKQVSKNKLQLVLKELGMLITLTKEEKK